MKRSNLNHYRFHQWLGWFVLLSSDQFRDFFWRNISESNIFLSSSAPKLSIPCENFKYP